jgi:ubiquinone/menaquinone biosynthesis C-methylase UbiE
VLFCDIRTEIVEAKDKSCKSGLRTIDVKPDLVADFTEMPFKDGQFAMVVFDPPHLKTLGQNSWMAKKYGRLPNDWEYMISKGFDECMRVLKQEGTLIFKWNENEIPVSKILEVINYNPLFGHKSGKRSNTHWIAFMKMD